MKKRVNKLLNTLEVFFLIIFVCFCLLPLALVVRFLGTWEMKLEMGKIAFSAKEYAEKLIRKAEENK